MSCCPNTPTLSGNKMDPNTALVTNILKTHKAKEMEAHWTYPMTQTMYVSWNFHHRIYTITQIYRQV